MEALIPLIELNLTHSRLLVPKDRATAGVDVKRSFLIAVIDVAVGDCSHSGHYPRSAERDRPAVRGSGAKSPLAVAAGVNQRLAVGVGRWLVDIRISVLARRWPRSGTRTVKRSREAKARNSGAAQGFSAARCASNQSRRPFRFTFSGKSATCRAMIARPVSKASRAFASSFCAA